MKSRAHLRSQIEEAWRLSIEEDYVAQRINSERSLQASVWSNLIRLLPSATRRMFIEPCMSVRGDIHTVRYPDLVVCNTREVIGIIELKYQPRSRPSWEKDISTFQWINENRSVISVSNDRFRGVSMDARRYPLASQVLYVWAGVHSSFDIRIADHVNADLRQFFLALHAETGRSGKPKIKPE